MLVWTLAKTSSAQVCGADLPVLPWGLQEGACTPMLSRGPAFPCCLGSLAVLLPADPPWCAWITSWFHCHRKVLPSCISPALPKAASALLPAQGPNEVGE